MKVLRCHLHIAATLALILAATAAPLQAQAPETEYEGAAALGVALRRLGATERVLMIAAHPDDENTAVLSALALGAGADVAYLSLTRGEGGQNGIGPELQEALGIIRSEELLAARRLDGARQFFTRAYDYGFSKSAEEAFGHWPRDSILGDAVAVIRQFRPDVVITIFGGTTADGHGQHQAAGIIAAEAYSAAADPSRFPDQLQKGLRPHRPSRLYHARWRDRGEGGVVLQTGTIDPLLGRSYHQIAIESRGRHRSQDMGRALVPGPQRVRLRRIDRDAPAGESIFAGLETTLSARASSVGATLPRALISSLREYDELIPSIREAFNPLDPGRLVPSLVRAAGILNGAEKTLAGLDASPEPRGERTANIQDGLEDLRFHIAAELDDLNAALQLAGGIVIDAISGRERVIPGQSFDTEIILWNGGAYPIAIDELYPDLPEGWTAQPIDTTAAGPLTLGPGTIVRRSWRVTVPRTETPTEPYYLREPRPGAYYSWPDDPSLRGLPFEPPPLVARVRAELEGIPLELAHEIEFRAVSTVDGESRRPVLVVPAASLTIAPRLAILPVGADSEAEPLAFTIEITTDAPDGIAGTIRLRLPPGWNSRPAAADVDLAEPGERREFEFRVTPPPGLSPGSFRIEAVFEDRAGEEYRRGYRLIDYPHIRIRPIYQESEAVIEALELLVADQLRVAYIPGAGDAIPEALRQLGIDVTLIDPSELAAADLSDFHTVILGIRAYEHRPELRRQNRRLLEYMEGGGTLIVQYNQYRFSGSDLAPYPLTISRPHDRVTDETAPVTLLDPDHPILSWPNRITKADFEGWVQERGLYFPRTWDDRYTPLLAMSDPGEAPLRGGILVAKYGRGTYIYTGLAFFRQLPAGVPGAFRLFANLVSQGARGQP